MTCRHVGQVNCLSSQFWRQYEWNKCPHWSFLGTPDTCAVASVMSSLQMMHTPSVAAISSGVASGNRVFKSPTSLRNRTTWAMRSTRLRKET